MGSGSPARADARRLKVAHGSLSDAAVDLDSPRLRPSGITAGGLASIARGPNLTNAPAAPTQHRPESFRSLEPFETRDPAPESKEALRATSERPRICARPRTGARNASFDSEKGDGPGRAQPGPSCGGPPA